MKRYVLLMVLLLICTSAMAAEVVPATAGLPPVVEMYKGYIILGLSVAWGISEALALIPCVKSNGIFHAFYITLGKILGKEEAK